MNSAGAFVGNYAGMGMLLDHDSLSIVRGGGSAGGGAGRMGGDSIEQLVMGARQGSSESMGSWGPQQEESLQTDQGSGVSAVQPSEATQAHSTALAGGRDVQDQGIGRQGRGRGSQSKSRSGSRDANRERSGSRDAARERSNSYGTRSSQDKKFEELQFPSRSKGGQSKTGQQRTFVTPVPEAAEQSISEDETEGAAAIKTHIVQLAQASSERKRRLDGSVVETGPVEWESAAGELTFEDGTRQQELTAESLKLLNRKSKEQQPRVKGGQFGTTHGGSASRQRVKSDQTMMQSGEGCSRWDQRGNTRRTSVTCGWMGAIIGRMQGWRILG